MAAIATQWRDNAQVQWNKRLDSLKRQLSARVTELESRRDPLDRFMGEEEYEAYSDWLDHLKAGPLGDGVL